MQPILSREVLAQLEPFVSSDRSLNSIVEEAALSYINWQNFIGRMAVPGTGNDEALAQKFNHLLAQTQQDNAELIKSIAELRNDCDRRFALLAKGTPMPFVEAEVKVLRTFARSMGATVEPPEEKKPEEPSAPIVLFDSSAPELPPAPQSIEPGIKPPSSAIDLASLSRSELIQLCSANGIPCRNKATGKVWRMADMVQLLTDLQNINRLVLKTASKKRGRGRPKAVAS